MNIFSNSQKTNFFICFFERSGSTMLTKLLDSHPDIRCFHEVFHMVVTNEKPRVKRKHETKENALALLRQVFHAGPEKIRGFKFKYPIQYEQYSEIKEYLYDNKDTIRLIFLKRNNLLKNAISKQNQKRLIGKGLPSNLDRNNFVQLDKLELDIDSAFKYMRMKQSIDKEYMAEMKTFKNFKLIQYEDLTQTTLDVMNEVYDFLGAKKVEKIEAEDVTLKITDNNIENAISNFDELVEKIKGTEFEQYLSV